MPPILSTAPSTIKVPATTAWFLMASLLLSILWFGHLARPALAQPKTGMAKRSTTPDSGNIVLSAWRP